MCTIEQDFKFHWLSTSCGILFNGTQKDAERTVELAIERNVVGVEFSGNPLREHYKDFSKIFDKAREGGLKITIHLGETVYGKDTYDILDFSYP